MKNESTYVQNPASKILEYWFAMEFLAQDSYPNYREIQEKVKTYKVKGVPSKTDMINDALTQKAGRDADVKVGSIANVKPGRNANVKAGETADVKADGTTPEIEQLMKKEASDLGMTQWGNITVYIGKIMREDCIGVLSRVLPVKDEDKEERPEKSRDSIAMASLQLSPEGKYVEGSLSVSTILWSMNQIKGCSGNLSDALDQSLYEKEIEELEKKFFSDSVQETHGTTAPDENVNNEDSINTQDENEVNAGKAAAEGVNANGANTDKTVAEGAAADKTAADDKTSEAQSAMQQFSISAVTWKELKDFYSELVKRYLKKNYSSEMEKFSFEEIYSLEFQLFKNADVKSRKEEDHYLGLSHDYFSNDITGIFCTVFSLFCKNFPFGKLYKYCIPEVSLVRGDLRIFIPPEISRFSGVVYCYTDKGSCYST